MHFKHKQGNIMPIHLFSAVFTCQHHLSGHGSLARTLCVDDVRSMLVARDTQVTSASLTITGNS
jgi:hypothetical protein